MALDRNTVRRAAVARFDISETARRYLQLYEEMMDAQQRRVSAARKAARR
jgi:hypothetical protein